MKTYRAIVPGFAPFDVQAVPSLAPAVAAVTLELEELPAGAMLIEVAA